MLYYPIKIKDPCGGYVKRYIINYTNNISANKMSSSGLYGRPVQHAKKRRMWAFLASCIIARPEESQPTKKLKVDFQCVLSVPEQFATVREKMPTTLKPFWNILINFCIHIDTDKI